MYKKYYGLARKPFDLNPDPKRVFNSASHREAIAVLKYGVVERKGFIMLTGGVGTGKTTLVQLLVAEIPKKVHLCLIHNPTLSIDDFYHYLSAKYGLAKYSGKGQFMLDFADYIASCRKKGERVLLVIDEAHVLPVELLEEIRLLSNQQYKDFGVLSIFLVGQPELNERLADQRLLPLRQRIAMRFHLESFAEAETVRYIMYRLKKAGAQRMDLFSGEAIQLIHKHCKGVPRLINILCDQALLTGFAENRQVIEPDIIKTCIKEMHIHDGDKVLSLPAITKIFILHKDKIKNTLVSVVMLSIIFSALVVLLAQIYSWNAPSYWPGQQELSKVRQLLRGIGE